MLNQSWQAEATNYIEISVATKTVLPEGAQHVQSMTKIVFPNSVTENEMPNRVLGRDRRR